MLARSLVATFFLISVGVASLGAQGGGVREVTASERTLTPLNTKVRYTTMILLPEGEEILDVVCGDRDFWIISAAQNIAHVKPAREGATPCSAKPLQSAAGAENGPLRPISRPTSS